MEFDMRAYENEPLFINTLVNRVYDEYHGIVPINSNRRLFGGERNDVFLLEGEGKKYVMRIIHHLTDIRGVRYTNNWSRFAAERMPEANAPLLTNSGDTLFVHDGHIVGIYPFVDGMHSDRDDPQVRDEMAYAQAKLHRIGLIYPDQNSRPDRCSMIFLDLENNFLYNWDNVDQMLRSGGRSMFEDPNHQNEDEQLIIQQLYDRREILYSAKKEFSILVKKLRQNMDTLLYAPIHGDMYSSNVLVKNHKIVGIVDWDECNNEILVYELGRTCWEYCKDIENITFHHERAERYLSLYKEAGGPAPESQWHLMIPLLRMLKFMDIMLYLNNSIIGDVWDPAYGLESIIALNNLKNYRLI
jgi:Ser/Thr protein kinase RdoA (MazF antagonist)